LRENMASNTMLQRTTVLSKRRAKTFALEGSGAAGAASGMGRESIGPDKGVEWI
jgi:hypothetical protein